jgi:hypothetical protein
MDLPFEIMHVISPVWHEPLSSTVSDESIRQHLRSALDAIVSRETDRLRDEVGGTDARVAGRVRAMRPLIEALKLLSDETGEVGGLTIHAMTQGQSARIELVGATGACCCLAISTDAENRRFEIEEKQYFPLSGDCASYIHYFDAAEEVLRFTLEMIGTHIASRQARTANGA